MKENIKVVFFDLFFTLVTPKYNDYRNEYDVLKITQTEWEKYAEDNELYMKRATGNEKSPQKIIDSIIDKMKITITQWERNEILKLREERFRKSLLDVDKTILEVLLDIKKSGKKMCLISNADIIDAMHWSKSPLYHLLDDAIFSYEAGFLKPQTEIYEMALKKMKVNPESAVFIGDGGSDELKGAKELGMKTVFTGHLLKRDIKQQDTIKKYADYYIEDFSELRNII